MKIIDLLNKIANGEIETFYKFQYRNKIVTMGYLLDNYLFLEILNDEIELIEDDVEEEKKIPEKINIFNFPRHNNSLKKTAIKVNEIIDYLKSKG